MRLPAGFCYAFLCGALSAAPQPLRPDLSLRKVVETGGGGSSIRLARDPTDGALYYLRQNGSIYLIQALDGPAPSTVRIYSAADTGVNRPQGFAFGPEGNLYLTGNEAQDPYTVATVRRGVRAAAGSDARTWTTVARTERYPRSGIFDHLVNGVAVSFDGWHLYVNSGSRTDHGEEESREGAFPGLREAALTAVMLRLPADGQDLLLRNDRQDLLARGYLYAEGLRNSFDPALAPNGDLFAGENSGDRDDSEELNWIREGHHYGFPWRIGTSDTPQQFPGYDPEQDPLINHNYIAYRRGLFHDDPAYPPAPAVGFTDPVPNLGPDADSFRDPLSGAIVDGSALGVEVGTFTAHRSPLGLVFDRERALGGGFAGAGFILGWTRGDPDGAPSEGPFADAGEDLLHLELEKTAGEYRVRATRIVSDFDHPIDAEIAGNRLYVLENGGSGAVWEVTLPAAPPAPQFRRGWVNADDALDLSDAVTLLFHLFAGSSLPCADAADLEDDGRLSVSDAVLLLRQLYSEEAPPPEPFSACGFDFTSDAGDTDLGCAAGGGCN